MTQKVISTSEVNQVVRNIKPPKIYSVKELMDMGLTPLFQTNTGTYWAEETKDKLLEMVLGDKSNKDLELEAAFDKGYKEGRRTGIENGMRNMHNIFMEYLMDTNFELAKELQHVTDSFLKAPFKQNWGNQK